MEGKSSSDKDKTINSLSKLVIRGDYAQLRSALTAAGEGATRATRSKDGRTALWLAADVGASAVSCWQYAKCLELLLHLGADPAAADSTGDAPAHAASRRNNARFLARLPFEAKFVVNRRSGRTPLMEAAASGSWACAKHLAHLFRQKRHYDRKQQLMMAKDAEGRTAVDLASDCGHEELAELLETELSLELVQVGDVLSTFTITGLTSEQQRTRKRLSEMAKSDDIRGLRRLATRANCDLPDEAGFTALAWAVKSSSQASAEAADGGANVSNVEVVEFLLSLDADATAANVTGFSCLHCAAAKGGRSAAVRIQRLAAVGADVNCADWWGRTPLMQAAWNNAPEAARALLDGGADWSRADQRGETTLAFASKAGNTETATLLRSYEGKIFFDEPVESPDLVGWTSDLVEETADCSESDSSEESSGKRERSSISKGIAVASFSPGPGYYPVTSPKGICLVININRYDRDTGLSNRDGSEKDVARVAALFGDKLEFRLEMHTDLRGHEVARCLSQTAYKDHSAYGAFACFLMAHGTNEAVYGRDGVPQYLKDLTTPFHGNCCPSLAGKPKIFFVQACRGSQANVSHQHGVKEDSCAAPAPVTSRDFCPKNSDFLFCYASSEDAPAYRDTRSGSLFVQTLCQVIEAGHARDHLLDMMTEVNRQVRDNPVRKGERLYLHVVTDTHSQLAYKVSFAQLKK